MLQKISKKLNKMEENTEETKVIATFNTLQKKKQT